MSDPIRGIVHNGKRAPVKFSFYAGMAGIRERDGHMDVAFLGRAPRNYTPGESCMIDGDEMQIMSIDTSTISRGMVLVKVEQISAS